MLLAEGGAHFLQAVDVQVDLPRADVAAAGHRHPRAPGPGQERAQDKDRGPHPADQLVGGLDLIDARGVDGNGVPLPGDLGPEVLEHVGHREAVLDTRHVVE